MKHTERPLSEKIDQVKKYCEKFPVGKKKYYGGPYVTHYTSDNVGNIQQYLSNCRDGGLAIVGTYSREEIINLFIDYFGLYEENQFEKSTRL